jgi:hypothetical protein
VGVYWIELVQVRDRLRALLNAVISLLVALNEGKFLTSCKPTSFSRRTLLSGLGGLVVSMVACGTQYRGFEPGRNRRSSVTATQTYHLPSRTLLHAVSIAVAELFPRAGGWTSGLNGGRRDDQA